MTVFRIALLPLFFSVAVGCGGRGGLGELPEPAVAGATSAADYFDKANFGRMLPPAGRYAPSTAQDAGEGKVRFRDTAGKTFEVTATREGEAYKFGAPAPAQ